MTAPPNKAASDAKTKADLGSAKIGCGPPRMGTRGRLGAFSWAPAPTGLTAALEANLRVFSADCRFSSPLNQTCDFRPPPRSLSTYPAGSELNN